MKKSVTKIREFTIMITKPFRENAKDFFSSMKINDSTVLEIDVYWIFIPHRNMINSFSEMLFKQQPNSNISRW